MRNCLRRGPQPTCPGNDSLAFGREAGLVSCVWGYGEEAAHRSVADITDPDSLARVRAYKQEMKAAAKGGGATA